MKYPVAFHKWGEKEYLALMTVLGSDRYTCGERVAEFEKAFCEKFGFNYAVMTNSGSSANLLIVSALVYSGILERRSTIIVPAIAWSTSYAPFIQFGMKLKIVDIDAETLGYDIDALLKTDAKDTSAILIVNMLGNCNEYDKIMEYAQRNRLHVIEDNCEAMGAKYENKSVGSMGIASSFSTFYSHHISTMEGGIAVTPHKEIYEIMLSLRSHGWSRDIKKPQSFHDKYTFLYPGYNLRPTEVTAAIGLTQLERFSEILDGYRKNALFFKSTIGQIDGIKTQEEIGKSSWMGFYILAEGLTEESFPSLCKTLESQGIEIRPIMCCFHKQQMRKFANVDISRPLINANKVYERGFYVGNSCKDISKQIMGLFECLTAAFENDKRRKTEMVGRRGPRVAV